MDCPGSPHEAIESFVVALWLHIERKVLGVASNELAESVKSLRKSLKGFDPVEDCHEIGKALSGHVLNHAIQVFRSDSCFCSVTACEKAGHVYCKRFQNEADIRQFNKAVILEGICRLDGVYNLNAQKLVSVIKNYWDLMEAGGEDQTAG